MHEASLLSTFSPAFIACRFFWWWPFDQCEMIPHCHFDLHFCIAETDTDVENTWMDTKAGRTGWEELAVCDLQIYTINCCLVAKSCPTLGWPHGLQPARFLCPWDFPDKNTGGGYHFLLRGSSQPRDQTWISYLAGRFFNTEPPGKQLHYWYYV